MSSARPLSHSESELQPGISNETEQKNKDMQEEGYRALTLVQREHDDNVQDMEALFKKVEQACIDENTANELRIWKSQHALTMRGNRHTASSPRRN